jgi:Fe2+ or Zn2+ uptake regulation protein
MKASRMTKARKDLLEILSTSPSTIASLHDMMKQKGHFNIQTIYNNLHHLEATHQVYSLIEDGEKVYHLISFSRLIHSDLSISCHSQTSHFDIQDPKMLSMLQALLGIPTFHVTHVSIDVSGSCIHEEDGACQKVGHCKLSEELKLLFH